MKTKHGITVVDLFCGAGGFSLGFHQAGFDVVLGIDNWKTACEAHEINGLGITKNFDLLDFDADKVFSLKKELEAEYGKIDVLIGSPPCTEFSFAKKGGKGDLEKGMILVRRHLLFVAIFKPRYWLMENVPRLQQALTKECSGSKEKGWQISYKKLDISKKKAIEFGLEGNSLKIPKGVVVVSSDFGTHQKRKRFIAGDFPLARLSRFKSKSKTDVSLRGIICNLKNAFKNPGDDGRLVDPNYSHNRVKKEEIIDYDYDSSLHPMYCEETRHQKRRHIQYGRMQLPENYDAPSRTIMATYNAASRESIILSSKKKVNYHGRLRSVFRQPTVREVACIQGFPLNFKLPGRRLAIRYKLIGNAVPCQLSYALAKSIFTDLSKNKQNVGDSNLRKRISITEELQGKNGNLPIILTPQTFDEEAIDFGPLTKKFSAKPTKRFRRKLLSSTVRGSSYIVIFENLTVSGKKIVGGRYWKSCLQKGVGKQFHRIYIDDVAVGQLIEAITSSWHTDKRKKLIRTLRYDVEKGIPISNHDWIEFPGWENNLEQYIKLFSKKRKKIPNASFFQKSFTEEITDLGEFISPIDFFDGLDAIMINAFSKEEFKHLAEEFLIINTLNDSKNHPYRRDQRIVPELEDEKIPFVTVASIFLSVFVLFRMYQQESVDEKDYFSKSLKKSNDMIKNWLNS